MSKSSKTPQRTSEAQREEEQARPKRHVHDNEMDGETQVDDVEVDVAVWESPGELLAGDVLGDDDEVELQ